MNSSRCPVHSAPARPSCAGFLLPSVPPLHHHPAPTTQHPAAALPVPGPSCVSLLCATIIPATLAHSLLTCSRPEFLSSNRTERVSSSALCGGPRRAARDPECITLLMFPRTRAEPANIPPMAYTRSGAPAAPGAPQRESERARETRSQSQSLQRAEETAPRCFSVGSRAHAAAWWLSTDWTLSGGFTRSQPR